MKFLIDDNAPPPPPPPLDPQGLPPDPAIAVAAAASAFVPTPEQEAAMAAVDAWRSSSTPIFSLTGPAGSGKTTLLRQLVSRYASFSYRKVWRDRRPSYEEASDVALAALTGRAALRVTQLTGQGAKTMHSLLYWPPQPGEKLQFGVMREPACDLVIADEASMMGPQMTEHLSVWVDKGVKFLLVGDSFQLPPVITSKEERDKYGDDYSVFAHVPGVALKTVMRNAGGVLRAATQIRTTGLLHRQSELDSDGGGYIYQPESAPITTAVDAYLADPMDHYLITWRNDVRMKANHKIRLARGHNGDIDRDLPDPGEPVLIRKNGQGFLNGEVVECVDFEEGPQIDSVKTLWMRVKTSMYSTARVLVSYTGGSRENGGMFFDGQMPWIENWRKFHQQMRTEALPDPIPVTWGYCLTGHSAQGGQARRTTVFLERHDVTNKNFLKPTTLPDGTQTKFSARWLYTSVTRSTKYTTVIVGK